MDHAPALNALATCRTYDEAVATVGAPALEAAIRANAWAVLAAPEIWALLQLYYQMRRLDGLGADLEEARGIAMASARNPRDLLAIDSARDGRARQVRTGAAIVATAVTALSQVANSEVRLSRERRELLGLVQRAAYRVSCRIDDIRCGRVPHGEARDRLLGYLAATDPRLDVALAMARVWEYRPRVKRGDEGEVIGPDGQPEAAAIRESLPVLASTIDGLRTARERALSAGDWSGVAQLTTTIETAERQQRAEQATTEASGDGLLDSLARRVEQGAMG